MKWVDLRLLGLAAFLVPVFSCIGEIGADRSGGFVDRSDQLPPGQKYTTDVQLADIDEDGDLDILWANQPPEDGVEADVGLDIHRNDGTGRFEVVTGIGEE